MHITQVIYIQLELYACNSSFLKYKLYLYISWFTTINLSCINVLHLDYQKILTELVWVLSLKQKVLCAAKRVFVSAWNSKLLLSTSSVLVLVSLLDVKMTFLKHCRKLVLIYILKTFVFLIDIKTSSM